VTRAEAATYADKLEELAERIARAGDADGTLVPLLGCSKYVRRACVPAGSQARNSASQAAADRAALAAALRMADDPPAPARKTRSQFEADGSGLWYPSDDFGSDGFDDELDFIVIEADDEDDEEIED
jgi:hypothetical protein